MKGISIARLGFVAGATVLAAVITTGAAAQEGVFFKNMLGTLGLIPEEKDPIEYRERPPLVLPPRMDLRDPVAAGRAQVQDPQWPKDPDVLARQRKAAEARVPETQRERRRALDGANLTVDELRAGRRPGAEIPTAPAVSRGDNARDTILVHPDELRATARNYRAQEDVAEANPVRRTLTDPPSAFRRSATGAPIKRSSEPVVREDDTDPKKFIREEAQRNR